MNDYIKNMKQRADDSGYFVTDYIKREDAIKAVIADAKLKNLLTGNCENEKAIEGMVYEVLCPRDVPSADVVEVVRCKDCIYHYTWTDVDGCLYHSCARRLDDPGHDSCVCINDFCSYGERKEV